MIEAPGLVRYGDHTFKSLSTAANEARKASGYAGSGNAETNGWVWWRIVDYDGVKKPLQVLRTAKTSS